jgi:hypothetical protein
VIYSDEQSIPADSLSYGSDETFLAFEPLIVRPVVHKIAFEEDDAGRL